MLLAGVALACYVVLTVLVAAHVTDRLDAWARTFFWPDGEWGRAQAAADIVVEGLKPRNVAVLIPAVALVAAVHRSSWRPLAYAGAISVLAAGLTVLTKVMLARPDTHRIVTDFGGSYPSGHTATVLVSLGTAVLVLERRSRWWEWALVLLVGCAMGVSLLLEAAHWLTDVVGSVLLVVAVLAAASRWRLREPPMPPQER